MILDTLLLFSLGFLGSFGHCATMCGPVTVALGLSSGSKLGPEAGGQSLGFHLLLNLGRILSYGWVGAGLGAVGGLLVAGGQLAGLGSELRRGMAIATGLLLIWLSLGYIAPGLLPRLPFFGLGEQQHNRLSKMMVQLSLVNRWWTPLLLGLCWGLIPCGFLYTAQIRAAETGQVLTGALLMLAFGLGTTPTLLGMGWVVSRWSQDQRSQLFRLGGWVTLAVGLSLLLRTGDSHGGAFSAYGSLGLLVLALIARPVQHWAKEGQLAGLLRYRRGLGVGSFLLALLHILQIFSLNWGWNFRTVQFLIPQHRLGVALGLGAIALLTPAALTSFDRFQKGWGNVWRRIHLLTVPALGLAIAHTLLLDSRYWLLGQEQGSAIATGLLMGAGGLVWGIRVWGCSLGLQNRRCNEDGNR